MALPHTFANLSTAQMSFLDDNDAALGALTTVQATASGTNSLTLTPAANAPAVSAYGLPNPVRYGFVAGATSSGAVTARVNALAFLKVFLPNGVQANTGDIANGSYYEVVFVSSLDSGNGGWQIVSALPGSGTAPTALGSTSGLVITNNAGTPTTKIDITANKASLVTSTGSPVFFSGVSITIDLTTTGANGMDTGSRPTNGWAYLYLISNGSVVAGIATATSPTSGSFSPTPSGYIYSVYVGAMFLNGSSSLMRSTQRANKAAYQVVAASTTTLLPNIDNGTKGTYSITAPTWATPSVANFVPLTASWIDLVVVFAWKGNTASVIMVAPTNAYGGRNDTNGNIPWWDGQNSGAAANCAEFSMPLFGATIAWASNNAGGAISCGGWTDYYSR